MTLTVDGEALRRTREAKQLTREDVLFRARQLGHKLSLTTLARMEEGTDDDFRLSKVEAVAAGLGVEPKTLLTDTKG